MTFVQVIEYETTRDEELERAFGEWLTATEGKRTLTREVRTKDRDNPIHHVDIVEFPSYEQAMVNNELPETQRAAEQFRSLCTKEPRFINLEVIAEQK
jgi:hypothetical protein